MSNIIKVEVCVCVCVCVCVSARQSAVQNPTFAGNIKMTHKKCSFSLHEESVKV